MAKTPPVVSNLQLCEVLNSVAPVPIITTFEGAIPEIIEDSVNGFLVEQGNVEKLAEKIEYLFNDLDLQLQIKKSNFEKFENNYTFTQFENKMVTANMKTSKNLYCVLFIYVQKIFGAPL